MRRILAATRKRLERSISIIAAAVTGMFVASGVLEAANIALEEINTTLLPANITL